MKKSLIALGITIAATASLNINAESLLDVYQLSKQNDASLKAAKATYKASEEAVNISRGSLFPSISFSGSLGYSKTEFDETDSSTDKDSNSLSLDLSYPIYSSALSDAVDVVKLNYKSAGVTYNKAEEDLAYDVLEAYFELLTQQSNLQIARSHLTATASQLKKVKKQFEVGQVAITDVHSSQAEFDSNKVSVLTAESDVINAQETLFKLTGKRITTIPDLAKNYPIKLEKDKNASYYVDLAKQNNKDIQALRIAYENALTNISLQKSNGRSPTLALAGSITRSDSTSTPSSSNDGVSTTSAISLNLSIPLYEGGAISASVRQAVASADAAKESLNSGLQGTELAVRTLYRSLETSVAQIAAQQQLITSYSSVLKATQTGYNSGTRNIVDLLDAQSDLFDAQGTYEQLRYGFVLQKLALLQYIGELNEDSITQLNAWLKS